MNNHTHTHREKTPPPNRDRRGGEGVLWGGERTVGGENLSLREHFLERVSRGPGRQWRDAYWRPLVCGVII